MSVDSGIVRVLWMLLLSVCAANLAVAANVRFEKDLVYATVAGEGGRVGELRYDMACPAEGDGPFPLVVCVHAGGWQLGDKKSYRGVIRELAARGYVAVTVNYRLAPDYPWPAQLEDVRRAVRFFRARAPEMKIDPRRVGAIGDDCGAHLALMLGLLATADEKDVPVEQSCRIQAVANYFAPTDLREWRVNSGWVEAKIRVAFLRSSEQIIEDLVGTRDRTAQVFEEVSPVMHVTPGAPPVLTVIGTEDPLVSLEQARLFHGALKAAGVDEELMVVEGAEHSRESVNGKNAAADARMFAFFDKYLKDGAGQ